MDVEDIDLIADFVREAVAPLSTELKAVQASLGAWELRWNDIGAIRERMAVLEVRAPIPGPMGPVGPMGERGADGVNGTDGAKGLNGKDGADGLAGKDGAPGLHGKDGADGLHGKDGLTGKDGADGLNGKDGLPGLTGKDGADGLNGKDGAAGLNGKDGAPGLHGKDGADGLNGKDGIGVMDAMLDRAGQLIVTLSNGQTKAVGVVVGADGKDGAPGLNAKDIDPLFVQDFLTKELAKWPRPKDGADGRDGAPGLSLDDLDWDFDADTRAFTLKLLRDGKVVVERTKTLTGMRIYRGVYEQGRTYEDGDVVSWDGSEWTALDHTKERPGNGTTPWKLTVKHGEKGGRGPDGKPGRDGRDATQLGPNGGKW